MTDKEYIYKYLNANYSAVIGDYGPAVFLNDGEDIKYVSFYGGDVTFQKEVTKVLGNFLIDNSQDKTSFNVIGDWYDEVTKVLLYELNTEIQKANLETGSIACINEISKVCHAPKFSAVFIEKIFSSWYLTNYCGKKTLDLLSKMSLELGPNNWICHMDGNPLGVMLDGKTMDKFFDFFAPETTTVAKHISLVYKTWCRRTAEETSAKHLTGSLGISVE